MTPPVRRADITLQRIGAETVLHDSGRRMAHVVNDSAAWIWERLDGMHSTDEIAQKLSAQYGVALDVARNDVEAVTASFRQLQLLE